MIAALLMAALLSSPPAERGDLALTSPSAEQGDLALSSPPAQRGDLALSSPSAQRGESPGEGGGGLQRLAWDDDDAPGWAEDDEPARPHVLLSVWGGEALGDGGTGRSSSFFAAEAAWAFEHVDLGVQGAAYRNLVDATRPWTPVALLRLTQRFRGRRGAELTFGFGLGAGRPAGWTAWYQVALGVRVPLGPIFLGGELAFETRDLLRLGGGLGVAF